MDMHAIRVSAQELVFAGAVIDVDVHHFSLSIRNSNSFRRLPEYSSFETRKEAVQPLLKLLRASETPKPL